MFIDIQKTYTKVEGLTLLINRLPAGHERNHYLQTELRMAEAGIRGERRVAKQLELLYLDTKYKIFYDVQLRWQKEKFQIDCLVVTPKILIVLESKNISGNWHFDDENEEFYRVNESGGEESLPNPVTQLMRNKRLLLKWLTAVNISIPVAALIVMTAKKSRLCSKPLNAHVVKVDRLLEKIIPILEKPSEIQLRENQYEKLCKALTEQNERYAVSNLCEKYSIGYDDLRKGVRCTACSSLDVKRKQAAWYCLACGYCDKTLHLEAIREYFLYTNEPLTNERLREFCRLASRSSARNMLRDSGLQMHNKNKHAYYTSGFACRGETIQ